MDEGCSLLLEPCPKCGCAAVYEGELDVKEGLFRKGYRINFRCGYAWNKVGWVEFRKDAIVLWNARVKAEREEKEND